MRTGRLQSTDAHQDSTAEHTCLPIWGTLQVWGGVVGSCQAFTHVTPGTVQVAA